ncbi:MAG: VOC family protein [Gammaproteobacteria bacterium AqS3]|nr:VOC family protein [Gammaproteobacteria bacterium AqS3]
MSAGLLLTSAGCAPGGDAEPEVEPDAVTPVELPFEISGWSEIVLSVSDLSVHESFYRDVASWNVRHRGRIGTDQLSQWGLDAEGVSAEDILLGNADETRGFVRLVRFDGVEKRQIRSNTQSWDTGGIFDFNVRVADMQAKFGQMQQLGWQGATDPMQFTFGPFTVIEWLPRGPDGVMLALIQRLAPPLEGWDNLREFSRTFNATQIVRDIDAALDFYVNVLGFQVYLEHRGASPEPGENVLGLPHNLAVEEERIIYIVHPEGLNEGSVELLQFAGLRGRDVSDLAVPPNLGSMALRFPVRGIDALVERLRQNDIPLETDLADVDLPPYGAVRSFAVRAPDGAWMEFFEVQSPGS